MKLLLSRSNRQGNVLLDVILVISFIIVCWLSYNELKKYQKNQWDLTLASQNCRIFAEAIRKHNSLEANIASDIYMKELQVRGYLSTMIPPDPWKGRYMHDYRKRIVFSCGPDKTAGTDDDVIVKY